MVEPARRISCELEVLKLVLSDRHEVGLVEQHVGGHEHGIREEADEDVLLPLALFFELRHPLQIAERRDVGEVPSELGVLADVALNEEGAAFGVETARDQIARHDFDAANELRGLVLDRDRVSVDDAEEELFAALDDLLRPRADGAEPVADVKLPARLNSGENARLSLRRRDHLPSRYSRGLASAI